MSDPESDLAPGDAAEAADVTVVSVPIDVTEDVIRQVGPRVRPDALLMDVTSVKASPVQAMLAATRASVVGTHPMFGPSVHSLQGQRVVLCRARGDEWADWAAGMYTARGLTVVETTPEHHDRMMAAVQVLTHFQTQYGLTSRVRDAARGVVAVHVAGVPDGVYVAARHFAQSADLYGPIERQSGDADDGRVRNAAQEVAEIRRAATARDSPGVPEVQEFWRLHVEALGRRFHDRLVERT